jgi:hypothetical protein
MPRNMMIRKKKGSTGLKIRARFDGRKAGGNIILRQIEGDITRDHIWLNKGYNDFPANISVGSRISFFADIYEAPDGPHLTAIREVKVL